MSEQRVLLLRKGFDRHLRSRGARAARELLLDRQRRRRPRRQAAPGRRSSGDASSTRARPRPATRVARRRVARRASATEPRVGAARRPRRRVHPDNRRGPRPRLRADAQLLPDASRMGRVEESLVVCAAMRAGAPLAAARAAQSQARCTRCEAILGRGHRLSIDDVLALTVAAAAAYLIAINTPLLSLSLRGGAETATLPDAIADRLGRRPAARRDPRRDHGAPGAGALHRPAPVRADPARRRQEAAAASPGASAPCTRPARWNMVEVFTGRRPAVAGAPRRRSPTRRPGPACSRSAR